MALLISTEYKNKLFSTTVLLSSSLINQDIKIEESSSSSHPSSSSSLLAFQLLYTRELPPISVPASYFTILCLHTIPYNFTSRLVKNGATSRRKIGMLNKESRTESRRREAIICGRAASASALAILLLLLPQATGLLTKYQISPVPSVKTLQTRRSSTLSAVASEEDKNERYSKTSSSSKNGSIPFVNPSTIQFNNNLNRMARNFDNHSAQKVEDVLRKNLRGVELGLELEVQPNVVSFTAVINAWSRSTRNDAAERAEEILQWMIRLSGLPNVMHGKDCELYELSEDETVLADTLLLKPNSIAFNAAITAWIRSSGRDSHNHAERLMNQLWELYVVSGNDPDLKPTARTFNLVINAIARSRELKCGDRASALLSRMEDLYVSGDDDMQPEPQTFGAIINAYANSPNDPQSTDKAAEILQQMNSMHQLGFNTKPNTFVYNACLNAFAKSEGNAEQAAQLLEVMERQYDGGDMSIKPDVISYSTCINAHANSKSLVSGSLADIVLNRMIDRYLFGDQACKPNAVAYTSTIKAWSTSASVANAKGNQTVLKQAATRAKELLVNMCLQYLAGEHDQKPTKVTFDLVEELIRSVPDIAGAERIPLLKRIILDHKLPRKDRV